VKRKLKSIFDAFELKQERKLDETEYLEFSKANKKALDKSIQQLESGKGIKVSLEDLL